MVGAEKSVACPRAGLRLCRRPHPGVPLRPPAHVCEGPAGGRILWECYRSRLRRLLELRARVPGVLRPDQGQGPVGPCADARPAPAPLTPQARGTSAARPACSISMSSPARVCSSARPCSARSSHLGLLHPADSPGPAPPSADLRVATPLPSVVRPSLSVGLCPFGTLQDASCRTRLDCPAVGGARSLSMAGPAAGSVTRAAWLSRSTWGALLREDAAAFLEKRPSRFAMRPSADMPPYHPWGMSGPFLP